MQSPGLPTCFVSRWHLIKGQAQLVGTQDDNKGAEPQHISFVILNRSKAEVKDPKPLWVNRNADPQGFGILRLSPQDDNWRG